MQFPTEFFLLLLASSLHVASYRNDLLERSMQICPRLFNCSDVEDIAIEDLIGEGAVKRVYRGLWFSHYYAVNVLKEPQFSRDFLTGLHVLQLLNASPHVIKLVGLCRDKRLFLSEFHQFGDARNVHKILEELASDSIVNRLKFCISYVEILEFLHSENNGVRVMCDSNDLPKTLSQFLVTDGLRLVLNDADALPSVSEAADKKIICGHREITSSFAAPEQLWPFPGTTFNLTAMPKYDEKTDIWKVPNVCEHFLGSYANHKVVKYMLFEIHKLCKSKKPDDRPSATAIKNMYIESLNKILLNS